MTRLANTNRDTLCRTQQSTNHATKRNPGEPRHDRDTPMTHFDQKVRHRDTALHSDAVRSHLARHAEDTP